MVSLAYKNVDIILLFHIRAEAIKGILNKPGTASPGSTSINKGVKDLSLRSTGESTPGGSTAGDKRPHLALTAKELDVLK